MEFDLENPLPTSPDFLSDRVTALFDIETDHIPLETYPQSLKATDSNVNLRSETISLIMHFCFNFDPFLSYLAVNYLDRFLSIQTVREWKPWILRLVAISCVSLALKMREMEVSVAGIQVQQDDGIIFDAQTIQRMENLILGALKWRMRSITPFSFTSFFVSLFKLNDPPLREAVKARATEIIFKAQNDFKLMEFKPSLIAASALLSASHELFPLQFPCFRRAILNCSYVNKDELFSCYMGMQEIVMDGYESVLDMVSSSSTPANVLEQHWSSSSSSSDGDKTSQAEAPTLATARFEKDLKRRKVSSFGIDNTFQLSQIQQCLK